MKSAHANKLSDVHIRHNPVNQNRPVGMAGRRDYNVGSDNKRNAVKRNNAAPLTTPQTPEITTSGRRANKQSISKEKYSQV